MRLKVTTTLSTEIEVKSSNASEARVKNDVACRKDKASSSESGDKATECGCKARSAPDAHMWMILPNIFSPIYLNFHQIV